MPFPDPRILNRFLDDYLEIRQSVWNSYSATVINTVTPVFSAISSSMQTLFAAPTQSQQEEAKIEYQDDATLRTGICTSLKERFGNAKTADDWVHILFELGEQGRKAQKHKSISNKDDALFCQTVNAIRTYIIHEHTELASAILDSIKKLTQEKTKLMDDILQAKLKSQTVKDLKSHRDAILIKLADLNDAKSIFDCTELGLFHEFLFPPIYECHELSHTRNLASDPDINFYKPWCYQDRFFRIYHLTHIHPRTNESFDTFKQNLVLSIPQNPLTTNEINEAKENIPTPKASSPKNTDTDISLSLQQTDSKIDPNHHDIQNHDSATLFLNNHHKKKKGKKEHDKEQVTPKLSFIA